MIKDLLLIFATSYFCLLKLDMEYNHLSQISCNLYNLVERVIGSEVIIEVRRTTTNLRDEVLKTLSEAYKSNNDKYPCYSGSKGEGLRFDTSDDDWVFVYKDIRVIPSALYTAIYESNTTLLMMENDMTKPGFTLLRLFRDSRNPWWEHHQLFYTMDCIHQAKNGDKATPKTETLMFI